MPTAAELSRTDIVRCLVYGRYKMGKTEGAATFPRPNFISFDRGTITVTSPGFRSRHPEVDLNLIQTQDFYERDIAPNGVLRSHNALDDASRYFDAWMNPKGGKWLSPYDGRTYDCHPDKFDTWVLDSATTLITASSNKAIMLMGDPGFAGKNPLSLTYAKAKQYGMIIPKKQDFGAERSMTEQFIRMLYDSGKHFVCIAHEKEEWEGEGEAQRMVGIVPLLTGQSVDRVCLMFDEVYRLTGHKEGPTFKRYLETVPNGIAKVGSRLEVPNGTQWTWAALNQAINPK